MVREDRIPVVERGVRLFDHLPRRGDGAVLHREIMILEAGRKRGQRSELLFPRRQNDAFVVEVFLEPRSAARPYLGRFRTWAVGLLVRVRRELPPHTTSLRRITGNEFL